MGSALLLYHNHSITTTSTTTSPVAATATSVMICDWLTVQCFRRSEITLCLGANLIIFIVIHFSPLIIIAHHTYAVTSKLSFRDSFYLSSLRTRILASTDVYSQKDNDPIG